jgi:DNA-directed RNA polymerase specialized sigma24 family protein
VTVTRRVAIDLARRSDRLRPTAFADRPGGEGTGEGALPTPRLDGIEDDAIERCSRDETSAGVREALGRIDGHDRALLLLLASGDRVPYREISRRVRRPIGSLGPTRMRLLGQLRADPAVQRLRVVA